MNQHTQPRARLRFISILLLFAMVFAMASNVSAMDEQLRKMLAVMNVGTAFSVAPGFIVTNKHVVEDLKTVTFMRPDKTTFTGQYVIDDAENDLVLFYVDPKQVTLNPLPLASQQSSMGTEVFTIGYPHPSVLGINPKLTQGHINAENGFADNPNAYQISTALQAGNSGGPLLDMHGNVVGITTWKLNAERMFKITGDVTQNVNYAVKVRLLQKLLNDIPVKWKPHTTPAPQAKLSDLVSAVKNDIFIVIAGEYRADSLAPKNLEKVKGSMFVSSEKSTQNMAVIVYAMPGAKEMSKSDARQNNLEGYSATIANMIAKEVPLLSKQRVRVKLKKFGREAEDMIYITDDNARADALCERYRLNMIMTVDYDNDTVNYSPNPVNLRIYDCVSKQMHRDERIVEYDHADSFAAEVELKKFVHHFFATLPASLVWPGR